MMWPGHVVTAAKGEASGEHDDRASGGCRICREALGKRNLGRPLDHFWARRRETGLNLSTKVAPGHSSLRFGDGTSLLLEHPLTQGQQFY